MDGLSPFMLFHAVLRALVVVVYSLLSYILEGPLLNAHSFVLRIHYVTV